jgi:hypothetical protein
VLNRIEASIFDSNQLMETYSNSARLLNENEYNLLYNQLKIEIERNGYKSIKMKQYLLNDDDDINNNDTTNNTTVNTRDEEEIEAHKGSDSGVDNSTVLIDKELDNINSSLQIDNPIEVVLEEWEVKLKKTDSQIENSINSNKISKIIEKNRQNGGEFNNFNSNNNLNINDTLLTNNISTHEKNVYKGELVRYSSIDPIIKQAMSAQINLSNRYLSLIDSIYLNHIKSFY